MAKVKESVQDKSVKTKPPKPPKEKGKNNLVGRVKKVIKKSRHRLSEEKFEKELQRTIEFLEQLQLKLDQNDGHKAVRKADRKTAKKAEKAGKVAAGKSEANKKSAKLAAAKNVGKKKKVSTKKVKKHKTDAPAQAQAAPTGTPSSKE